MVRLCLECRVRKTKSPRSMFCDECYEERRRKQLQDGQATLKKRRAKGQGGHRLVYAGRPTKWATENRALVKREAASMLKKLEAVLSLPDADDLKKPGKK